jgi:hypothetical protein
MYHLKMEANNCSFLMNNINNVIIRWNKDITASNCMVKKDSGKVDFTPLPQDNTKQGIVS